MTKTISIIGILLLAVAFNANARENDRIDQLEKEVQEIKIRLSILESMLSSPSKAHEYVASDDGWKLLINWRKLYTDMDSSDVKKILGEPYQVDGGQIAHWYYRNGGEVTFIREKVYEWREPRR